MKIVLHKHDLIISSSVGSGHSDKYSYVIPHEHLSGRQSHLGKIISIKYNRQFNLGFFFQMAISLLTYAANLPGQLCFWRSQFFTLLQSNYFCTAVTFSEELLLQSSCFFGGAPFSEQSLLRSCYFFSEKLLFQSKTSTEQPLLLEEEFFRIKTSTEYLPFQSRYFCTASTFSEELHFEKS